MRSYEKHMIFAFSLSAAFLVFNFYAVSVGMADSYYVQVTEWLMPVFKG